MIITVTFSLAHTQFKLHQTRDYKSCCLQSASILIKISNKMELCKLFQTLQATTNQEVDCIIRAHCMHEILQLPAYQFKLRPIEIMWSSVRSYVARHNVLFKMQPLKLKEQAIQRSPVDNSKQACAPTAKRENVCRCYDGI